MMIKPHVEQDEDDDLAGELEPKPVAVHKSNPSMVEVQEGVTSEALNQYGSFIGKPISQNASVLFNGPDVFTTD